MSENNFPRDDNLRLVLSKGHQDWLDGQTSEARKMILCHGVLMVVCLLWIVGGLYNLGMFEVEEQCVIVPEGSTIAQLQAEGIAPKGSVSCLSENPLPQPENEQGGWLSTALGIGAWLMSLLAVLMIPASIVDILRNIYKLYEFRGFSKDHDAFLKRYNRR